MKGTCLLVLIYMITLISGSSELILNLVECYKYSMTYCFNYTIGSPPQNFFAKIDFLSEMSWVISKNTITKVKLPFQYSDSSSTYKTKNITEKIIYNEIIDLFGVKSNDIMSFNDHSGQKKTINLFDFVMVTDVDNYFGKYPSFIGLGFAKVKSNSFIYQLIEQKIIDKAIIGVDITVNNRILFGGYDKSIVNENKIQYVNIYEQVSNNKNYSNKWISGFESVAIDNFEIKIKRPIVFDIGSNKLNIPLEDYLKIKNYIFKHETSKEFGCQYQPDSTFRCKCDLTEERFYPIIKIKIQNFSLEIHPKDYISFDSSYMEGSFCQLEFGINYNSDEWIIGNTIMNNYYTIYDYDNQRIGFYGLNGEHLDHMENFLIIFGIFFGVGIVFLGVFCLFKKFIPVNTSSGSYDQVV